MSLGVVLTIIFTVLKLTHFIAWTWPTVFVPLIVEAIFDVVVFIGFLLFVAILK